MTHTPGLNRIAARMSSDETLDHYYAEIKRTPLLSAHEEQTLAHLIRQGDPEARERLACANLRLVVCIARTYLGKGMDLADLIAEGNLGLMRAVEGFDPSLNTRFSTYASYWVRQSIERGLINAGRTIRLPNYTTALMSKWRCASARLQDELGRMPTHEEVAESLHISRKKLKIVKQALRIDSGVSQAGMNGGARSSAHSFAGTGRLSPEAEVIQLDQMRYVFAQLKKMGERERNVLQRRFGLDSDEPQTLQAIANSLGLTRERVRQIERQALLRLRQRIDAE